MVVRESQDVVCPAEPSDQGFLRWWQDLPVAKNLQRSHAAHCAALAVRARPACNPPHQQCSHCTLKYMVLIGRRRVALDA
eukprot:4572771-Pyramimonas_sp.AAC.1